MLYVSQVNKRYGAQPILEEISFVLNPGQRAGLVGPNGGGKTTLLRIVAGLEPPDSGSVSLAPTATLGYLPQGLEPAADRTVGEEVRAGIPGWEVAHKEVDRLAARMSEAQGDELDQTVTAYGEALTRFEALGGYAVEQRTTEVLAGLDLAEVFPDTPLLRLSGGQRTRVGLARILLAEPTLLLLDEPINHLDIPSRERFQAALEAFPGTVLAAAHDRAFIDQFATGVWVLENGVVQRYEDREEAARRGG